MDQGFGTPGGTNKSMISGPKNKEMSEVSQVFFGGNLALLKSFKNHFPMVRVINFRSFSSFFCEFWALLESFKNDFPMVRAKIKSQKFLKFFFLKLTPRKIMKTRLFGHSLNPGALGTLLGFKSAKFCSG